MKQITDNYSYDANDEIDLRELFASLISKWAVIPTAELSDPCPFSICD